MMTGEAAIDLTRAAWAPLTGDAFAVDGIDAAWTLAEVVPLGESDRRFALHFRGAPEPVLPSLTYLLRHADTGEVALFVSAIGQDDRGVMYEAIVDS